MSARVLALIMAGGAGGRMDLLTDVRAKPALPFGGVYRLIDIPLSNCAHSGFTDVWVVEQFQPHSLNEHLHNGRPWDLDRTHGGLRILPPHQGSPREGWHRGNADALYRNSRFIRQFAPDLVVVLSSDHVYKFDYRQAMTFHQAHGADLTLVTTRVEQDEASRFGVVQCADDGRVTEFAYKPDQPASNTVTTEIFIYDAATLLTTLDELADADTELSDFGNELVPRLVEHGRTYSFDLGGYWRDVGTIPSYWQAHMELLADEPPLQLDDPAWPIRTLGVQRLPARITASARIDNSLIAPGCLISGEVTHSVIGPGVRIEAGAVVRDAVVFRDVVIERDVTVERAIVDAEAHLERRVQLGPDGDDEIALVGKQARVAGGSTKGPQQRIPPRVEAA